MSTRENVTCEHCGAKHAEEDLTICDDCSCEICPSCMTGDGLCSECDGADKD